MALFLELDLDLADRNLAVDALLGSLLLATAEAALLHHVLHHFFAVHALEAYQHTCQICEVRLELGLELCPLLFELSGEFLAQFSTIHGSVSLPTWSAAWIHDPAHRKVAKTLPT